MNDWEREATMELVRGLHNVDRAARGCVLTIGAFDGIHRGHQQMIRVLRTIATTERLPAALELAHDPGPFGSEINIALPPVN